MSPGSYESSGAENRPLAQTPITGLSSFIRQKLNRINQDAVSKVVDVDGKPLVVCCGTVVSPDTDEVKGMGDIQAFDRIHHAIFAARR